MGTVQETVGHSSTSPRCLVLLFSVEPLIKSIMGKKKCFMTPERKKKLRTLLRKKAAGAQERAGVQSRGTPSRHCREVWHQGQHRGCLPRRAQEDLPDLLRQVVQPGGRDVLPAARSHPQGSSDQELTISVSDMRGKFIKPTLKKVSKYENKFAKLQEKAAKFAFANQLKASKG